MSNCQAQPRDLRQQYAIKRQIDEAKETIIQLASQFADKVRITETGMTAAQLSHLQRVAQQAASVSEVLEWVRYHSSRRNSPWAGHGVKKALEAYIKNPENLSDITSVRQVAERIGQDLQLTQAQTNEIWLKLARHFAGYLRRRFMYLIRERGSGR